MATKSKSKSKTKIAHTKLRVDRTPRLSDEEKRYFQFLHKLVDDIFEEATYVYDMTWNQLATNAGVSPRTVTALGDRDTRYPHLQTIYKLASAIGWEVSLTNDGSIVKRKKAKIKLAKAG